MRCGLVTGTRRALIYHDDTTTRRRRTRPVSGSNVRGADIPCISCRASPSRQIPPANPTAPARGATGSYVVPLCVVVVKHQPDALAREASPKRPLLALRVSYSTAPGDGVPRRHYVKEIDGLLRRAVVVKHQPDAPAREASPKRPLLALRVSNRPLALIYHDDTTTRRRRTRRVSDSNVRGADISCISCCASPSRQIPPTNPTRQRGKPRAPTSCRCVVAVKHQPDAPAREASPKRPSLALRVSGRNVPNSDVPDLLHRALPSNPSRAADTSTPGRALLCWLDCRRSPFCRSA